MIAAAIGLSVAGIAAFSVLPVMIGALIDARGLGDSEAGYVATADLCGFAFAALAAIFWIDQSRWRRMAGAGLLVLVAGNLWSLQSQDLTSLLAARLVAGIGGGTAYAVAMSMLARSTRADRAFGIMVAVQIAFQVIALFALPRLAAIWGPSAIFLVLAGTACFVFPAILQRFHPANAPQQVRATTIGSLSGWFAVGAVALFSLNLGALWTYVERIGVGAGLSSPQTGTVLSVSLALSLFGAIAASWLGERMGRRLPFVLAAAAQLAALILLREQAGATAFTIGAALYSLAWAFAVPYLYIVVASQDASGRMIVVAPAAQAIGAGLGPALVASLLAGESYLPATLVAAAALVAAMLCMLGAGRARLQA